MAGVYLAALYLFHAVSVRHWFVLTGLHLAALMLVPYRYWPALFVADTAQQAYVSYICFDQFGLLWAVLNTISSLAYEAPVVWWLRERWRLFPSRGTVNMPIFVLCALIISIIATVETIVQVRLATLPPGYVVHYRAVTARMVLGNFMGVLTVAPIS
ncbi:MAG TPA: MASE1 domain-containing protein, partial [Rhodanobacter sp.]